MNSTHEFSKWAPPDLVKVCKELRPKAAAERKRFDELEVRPGIDWRTYLEQNDHISRPAAP
jgi:hypothetical protein